MHSAFRAHCLECPSSSAALTLSWVTLWWQWSMSDFSVHLFTHYASAFLLLGQRDEVEYASFPLPSCLLVPTRLQVLCGCTTNFDHLLIEGQSQLLALCFWLFGCWITEYQLHANIIKYRANTECSQWFWSLPYFHTTMPYYQ